MAKKRGGDPGVINIDPAAVMQPVIDAMNAGAGDPDDLFADPASVVRAFIAAMHAWELAADAAFAAAHRTADPVSYQAPLLAGQNAVFARYCTPKARPYGRNGSYGTPPEYQPEHEPIQEVVIESPRRAAVYTQRGTGFRFRQKYVLLRKTGRWLIDSVKYQSKPDGPWTNNYL